MDAATVTVDNRQTFVETVLDIAAHTPAAGNLSVLPENALMLVFYEGEQIKATSLQDSSITLDENGIAQITVSASSGSSFWGRAVLWSLQRSTFAMNWRSPVHEGCGVPEFTLKVLRSGWSTEAQHRAICGILARVVRRITESRPGISYTLRLSSSI